MTELENINPNVYKKTDERKVSRDELNEIVADPIDEREVFGKHQPGSDFSGKRSFKYVHT